MGDRERGSAPAYARGPRDAAAAGGQVGPEGRRGTLGEVPRSVEGPSSADRTCQCGGGTGGTSGTGGYGRHTRRCACTGSEPAARPRGHEDVVKTDPTFWLLARASGLTAYGLLTASVLAGLVLKSKPFGRALKPAPTMDVHRFLALLGLGMLTLHGGTLLLDQTLHMPIAGLFLPGSSPYRPPAVAVGVVAAELMALIYVSFFLRRRIGGRNWRR